MIRKVICLIIPFIVTVITVVIINNFLDNNINEMLEKKELSWASKEYNSVYKDKGVRFNNYFADNDYILLQATSELNVKIPQAPMKFFPIEGMNDVETVGIQGGQSIVHLSVIGSESRKNKNRKVALIVSLQWFYNKDGMTADDFQSTFSPVQFYSFMDNEKISDKNKYRYAVRINDLLKGTSQYSPEKLYAKLYINKSVLSRMVKYIFEPYFLMRKQSVTLKDKGLLYKKLKTLNDKEVTTEFRKIDWDEEYEKSYEEGKESITNNDYMVYDDYYNKYKPDLELHKNYLKDRDILNSKEYDDFQLYLDVCSDMGIKPYIILMPTNGKWYDELGIKKENRDEFYAKLEKISEDNGCEVLNFSDREYEPYFMYDGTHFGWKGWLEVDEQLYKHFQNR
ncbi:D-alanyl-lipoteichoic acid biosynthesis protein DltD [uncultured Clostridium sp.]|uniref:D-alanyl-lipoteichoic acid biosynthesis protein DltD n=1 Tax=uncultured Clostridium sp. TaxID=59620 RepID=UPI0025F590FE|nr:D-alanyl-lipoteichoic acid biosynthesis protein DltD [uncultured Clostridium sp.]